MVKVTLDLSDPEIEMFSNCIQSALNVKPMNEDEKKTAILILKQLSHY